METLFKAINLLRSLTIGEAAATIAVAAVTLMALMPAIGSIGMIFMLVLGITHLASSKVSNAK